MLVPTVCSSTCHHCLTLSSLPVFSKDADCPFLLLRSFLPSRDDFSTCSTIRQFWVVSLRQPSLRSLQFLPFLWPRHSPMSMNVSRVKSSDWLAAGRYAGTPHTPHTHKRKGRLRFSDALVYICTFTCSFSFFFSSMCFCGRWVYSGSGTPRWICASIWILCQRDCEGENDWKIGEVGERERLDVLSDKCCKG